VRLQQRSRRLLVGDRVQHAHALRCRERQVERGDLVRPCAGRSRSPVRGSQPSIARMNPSHRPAPRRQSRRSRHQSTAPAPRPALRSSPPSAAPPAARSIRAGRPRSRAFRSSARPPDRRRSILDARGVSRLLRGGDRRYHRARDDARAGTEAA
jgi:hypothetical protein